jgi:DNA (cytosine-5)-methyltransferase 1
MENAAASTKRIESARTAQVVDADGRLDLDLRGVKASIEFAHTGAGWIAEFRFRFRGGAYQGCALPLTASSSPFRSKTEAVAGAASRLLASAESAIEGDELGKAQAAAMAALSTWCERMKRMVEDGAAVGPLPLAGMRFLDLFAGIGGFHCALAALGGECAGAVEIDANARDTYRRNHGRGFPIEADIRACGGDMFGSVDIVCGGFPCQSFSVAGDGEGFAHQAKGALFFELARMIGELSPSIAILENVKGLCSHDGGRTYDAVVDRLAGLGYSVSSRVLDAGAFGLAQTRERLFLVCVHDRALSSRAVPYVFPKGADAARVVADILEPHGPRGAAGRSFERSKPCPSVRSQKIEVVGHIEGRRQQGYRVASALGKSFTLCANSGGLGRAGLYMADSGIRSLTARECARLQGFPDSFAPHPRLSTAIQQFGNAVAVPVVGAIARRIPRDANPNQTSLASAQTVPKLDLGLPTSRGAEAAVNSEEQA